jgi:hypothetical protein
MGLGQIYAKSLQAALADKAQVYRYADSLTALWSNQLPTSSPIVIVWDRKRLGESPDDGLLEKHLTPLDWALAWSLKQARDKNPVPPIVIIDATVGIWKDTWAWSVRYQLLADMPWVTLALPVVREEDDGLYQWVMTPVAMDAGGIDQSEPGRGSVIRKVGCDWELDAESKSPPSFTVLERLNKLWIASLRLSDEDHDINNIIGVRVLLEPDAIETGILANSISIPDQTPAVTALLARSRWSDLQRGTWSPWESPTPEDLYGKTISAILVDDKQASGWDTFLRGVLGHRVEVISWSSTKPLIEFLNTQERTFDRRDFTARVIRPTGERDDRPEIIFLDFRLYRTQDAVQMRSDIGKLLHVAEGWKGEFPAWEPIPSNELVDIKNWLGEGGSTTDDRYLRALLLLPRLLALALPLTPIILFSATGRALLREALKPYRNIFTGFQKPNPLADPESVQVALSALHEALASAAPMLRRGLQLTILQRIKRNLDNERSNSRLLTRPHADIFLDETGSVGDGIISALACNVYSGRPKSNSLHSALLVQFDLPEGVVWARRQGTKRAPATNPILRKSSGMAASDDSGDIRSPSYQVTAVCDFLARECSISVDSRNGWAVSGIKAPPMRVGRDAQTAGTLSYFPDMKLDLAMRMNIEFMLTCYLPFISGEDFTAAVYVPTRQIRHSDPISGHIDVDSFTVKVNEYGIVTYSEQAAFPLVRAWLQGWGDAYNRLARRIVAIKGRTLTGANAIRREDVEKSHLFHDVADWAAGSIAIGGRQDDPKSIRLRAALGGLFPRRFVCAHQQQSTCVEDFGDLRMLLDALIILSSNMVVENEARADAIRLIGKLNAFRTAGGLERLFRSDSVAHHRVVIWRLMDEVEKARGEALLG